MLFQLKLIDVHCNLGLVVNDGLKFVHGEDEFTFEFTEFLG